MKSKIVLLFLLLSSIVLCQEKTIFIKDSLTQEPVVFATVQFGGKIGGIYADENGKAIIPDNVKEIFISQIAYEKKTLDMRNISNNEVVVLSPTSSMLPEVVVSAIPLKRQEVGILKKKGSNGLIATPNTNFALFIPYDNTWRTQPYILSIISFFNDIKGSDEFPSEKCNIRFDLRLPDEEGAPGDISIIGEQLVHYSEKKYSGKETVNLIKPVQFPQEGIFVVIDFITPNNPNPNLLISPSIDVTSSGGMAQTWSKTITSDSSWKKMDEKDSAWSATIKDFFGKGATKMNLRAGLQIAY